MNHQKVPSSEFQVADKRTPGTRNPELATWNLEFETWNLEFGTRNLLRSYSHVDRSGDLSDVVRINDAPNAD